MKMLSLTLLEVSGDIREIFGLPPDTTRAQLDAHLAKLCVQALVAMQDGIDAEKAKREGRIQ